MKHGARIAAVVVGVALYAPILFILLLELLGPREVQTIGEVLRGDRCSAVCSPGHMAGLLTITLPAIATLPALIWVSIIWIRRARRGDRELKVIDNWLATDPPVNASDRDPEPELLRFYRDRQGRLRPLKSVGEDD